MGRFYKRNYETIDGDFMNANGMKDDKRAYWTKWLENKKIDHEFGQNVSKNIHRAVRREIENVRQEIRIVRDENIELKKQNAEFADLKEYIELHGYDISNEGIDCHKYNIRKNIEILFGDGEKKELLKNLKALIIQIECLKNKLDGE
jgi:hypothetical protein